MAGIPEFLKKKNDSLYYSGPGKFIFYVPEVYFDRKCAIIEGEFISLLGILDYTILKSDKDDPMKKLNTFNFPTRFYTKPGLMEKVKNLKLTNTMKPTDYRVLYYTDNNEDQIVVSTKVPQDVANVEDFFRLFVQTGNIPKTIPYDKLHEYFLESIRLNGGNYKISAQMFGIVVSEMCRDPHDLSKPFRLSSAINKDMKSFESVSIKDIPKFISAYAAITSENWDESVINAVMNKNETYSPLENIMMR